MDVVVVATADWDHPVWTNKQHLARRLAGAHRVLYVESVGLRRPTATVRDGRRLARRLARAAGGVRQQGERLWILSPLLVPGYRTARIRAWNGWALARQLHGAVHRLGFRQPVVWSFAPLAPSALEAAGARYTVYHVADALDAVPGVSAPAIAALEAEFLPHVDVVITVSRALWDVWRRRHRHVLYWPNVAEVEEFAPTVTGQVPPDPMMAAWGHPCAVYVGTIDAYKVDVDVLAALARRLSGWQFVVAGPVALGQPGLRRRLPQRANLHWIGPVAGARVPRLLAGADAALLLHCRNAYTAHSAPMKLRDYQAAGLPTVTTLRQWADEPGVLAADDPVGLAEALVETRGWTAEHRRMLAAYAAAFSWSRRLEEVEALLADAGSAHRA
jgi:hypothetical protein